MVFSFQEIIFLLGRHKYSFLFPVAVIEGPIITVIAGFLSSLGKLDFLTTFFVIVIGDLVGDSIYYILGRWGRKLISGRWSFWLGANNKGRIKNLDDKFGRHAGKTLFFTKFTRGIGVAVLFAAGVARVPLLKFLMFNFLGAVPKTFGLLALGYYFGKAYSQIDAYLNYFAVITIVIFIAVFFYPWFFKKKKTI